MVPLNLRAVLELVSFAELMLSESYVAAQYGYVSKEKRAELQAAVASIKKSLEQTTVGAD